MRLDKTQLDAALAYNKKRGYTETQVFDIQRAVGAKKDGVWGPETCERVAFWQAAHGLDEDGKVGPKTMSLLYPQPTLVEDVTPSQSPYRVHHPLPKIRSMWGYDHCPDTYMKPCPALEAATRVPGFETGLILLVTGARKVRGKLVFSRSPDSWISLDELSIGIAHWWADTAPAIFEAIADELPSLAKHAWGGAAAIAMTDRNWIRSQITVKRGKRPHQHKYDWLLAGWWEIGLHPEVIALQAREWLENYPQSGLAVLRANRWKLATTLAGLIRMANSRGGEGMKALVRKSRAMLGTDDETAVLENAFCHHKLYDHPDRWERILGMPHFQGPAPKAVNTTPLADFPESLCVRVDGSKPAWLP